MQYVATKTEYLDQCRSEIGYTENPPNSNRTKFAAEAGHPNGAAWCQTGLDAIAKRTHLDVPADVLGTAYTPTAVAAWKAAHRWFSTPEVGDWGYLNFDTDPGPEHVEVIERIDGSNLITIGFNTTPGVEGDQAHGGGVYRRTRARSLFIGFGRPNYTTEDVVPNSRPAVIVKAGSPELRFLTDYADLKGGRDLRVAATPAPGTELQAENPGDVGFGCYVVGSKCNYIGANRTATLIAFLRGERLV